MDLKRSKSQVNHAAVVLMIGLLAYGVAAEDITKLVLDVEHLDGYPVAYGDFNSDEMTDVFFLTNDANGHNLKILFGSEEPPLLKNFNVYCHLYGLNNKENIENEQTPHYFMVGDFDGDGALDVLLTHRAKSKMYSSVIFYGDTNKLHCDRNHKYMFVSLHHPIAIDYNNDLVIDFLITDTNNRTKIVTNIKRKQEVVSIDLFGSNANRSIEEPVRSSYVDVDGDKYADLVIATNVSIDVCNITSAKPKIECRKFASYPENTNTSKFGEMVFVDLRLTGNLDVLMPGCTGPIKCDIYWLVNGSFTPLNIFSVSYPIEKWNWIFLIEETGGTTIFSRNIYLRQVDFNMDGYPDFLVNLVKGTHDYRTFLIENVPCEGNCNIGNRKLQINWNGFSFLEDAISASVFDSSQNGNLDIFAVFKKDNLYQTKVFKHIMNENINFLKILVLSGKQNTSLTNTINVNKKMKYYGTPNIGTSISYHRLTQEGIEEKSAAVQNQKSAYMALELQYVIFGLGKTPEFVDNLTVSLNNQSKSWFLNIPNSQVVVLTKPDYWYIALFVTPSKLILYSLISLIGVCLALSVLIGVLHWRERQEDKKERLEGPHFHFDAM